MSPREVPPVILSPGEHLGYESGFLLPCLTFGCYDISRAQSRVSAEHCQSPDVAFPCALAIADGDSPPSHQWVFGEFNEGFFRWPLGLTHTWLDNRGDRARGGHEGGHGGRLIGRPDIKLGQTGLL